MATPIDLDRLEKRLAQTIEDGDLVGACQMYWIELGNHAQLGNIQAEFARGERITSSLLTAVESHPNSVPDSFQLALAVDRCLFLVELGRTSEAIEGYRREVDGLATPPSLLLSNLSDALFLGGKLSAARDLAKAAHAAGENATERSLSLAALGLAQVFLGEFGSGMRSFQRCRETLPSLENGGRPLLSHSEGRKLNWSLVCAGLHREAIELASVSQSAVPKERAYSELVRAIALTRLGKPSEGARFRDSAALWINKAAAGELVPALMLATAEIARGRGDLQAARILGTELIARAETATQYRVDARRLVSAIALEQGETREAAAQTEAAEIEARSCNYAWGFEVDSGSPVTVEREALLPLLPDKSATTVVVRCSTNVGPDGNYVPTGGALFQPMPLALGVPDAAVASQAGDPALRGASLFLSYRREDDSVVTWLEDAVRQLVERGYRVICDHVNHFASPTDALQQLSQCDVFLPVLTPGYEKYSQYFHTTSKSWEEDGWVFDEWARALQHACAGRMKLLGLLFESCIVPLPFDPTRVCDLRDFATRDTQMKAWLPEG